MIDLGQCNVIAKSKPLPHELTGLVTLFETSEGGGAPSQAYVFARYDLLRIFPIINGNQIDIQPPNNCFFTRFNQCCYNIVVVDSDCEVLELTSNGVTGDTISLCFNMPCSDDDTHTVKFIDESICETETQTPCLC